MHGCTGEVTKMEPETLTNHGFNPELFLEKFTSTDRHQWSPQFQSHDFLLTVFASALYSLKTTTLLKPYPSDYFDQNLKEIDRDRLIKDFELIFGQTEPERKNIKLIHWILARKSFQLKQIHFKDVDSRASRTLAENLQENRLRPKFIFQVTYPEDSVKYRTFSRLSNHFGSFYAFHGTAMENVYSILHYGLINSLNERSLFGKGTYLSSKLQVAILFSPFGKNFFLESQLGKKLSCVTLCEVVDHPDISILSKDTYYVVTNDELVRVAYLLLYSSDSSTNNLHHLNVSSLPFGGKSETIETNATSNMVFLALILLFIILGFFMTKSAPDL